MSGKPLYIGSNKIVPIPKGGTGEFVKIKGETFYKINGLGSMPTFFMTVVSSTDQWMFLASNGGLSAGRRNPGCALFPYYTDDKIIDSGEVTGSKSILKILKDNKWYLWEPFTERYRGIYDVTRNIYKNKIGSKVLFEECNHDLQVTFRYSWSFSNKFGFVKTSEVENNSKSGLELEVLDGLRNLLPYGVDLDIQASRSTLVDAYKKNELDKTTGLGVYSLSSMIVDKAEPSEALKATTVWSKGLENSKFLLSSEQLKSYRRGAKLVTENFTKASKACYFIGSKLSLKPKEIKNWIIVSEVSQSNTEVINLKTELETNPNIVDLVKADINKGSENLKRIVALADGQQRSNHRLSSGRHFSNVLFNVMRGGVFENIYEVDSADFAAFFKTTNPVIFRENKNFVEQIGESISYQNLIGLSENDADLNRICLEYLPLSFSRRHGDPSRPWNYFNIDLYTPEGKKKFNYEGNWRDIFQNWEALAFSFPSYIMGMITKFVNASTIDGYNPYRITRDGIDWEVIEPNDPWSYIGYWGDHQVIYLLKLLEHAENHFPGEIGKVLNSPSYVFANVPYRIRGFESILENPDDTIDFDHQLEEQIKKNRETFGADANLIWKDGKLLKSTLAEKLLIMALTKLYNFVPDGGIWLNTQRPEWNDANNALVGNGLSLVTLHYLRRFIVFAKDIFGQNKTDYMVHEATANLLNELLNAFGKEAYNKTVFTPTSRMKFVKKIGEAGEKYRTKAYQFFEGENKVNMASSAIMELFENALILIEDTIVKSKRADGLYHSYNLMVQEEKGLKISFLYEMLEGQVAAISSGMLTAEEVLNVLDELKQSKMYREDQYSYMLYPNKELKPFIEKNEIPHSFAKSSTLFATLISENDRSLIEKDQNGGYHFSGDLKNAKDVKKVLQVLKKSKFSELVIVEEDLVLGVFEEVFDHLSFTGRSGTFYGYEGLGSIYWHMVSKLLLAVQENILLADVANISEDIIGRLKDHYYEIRAGIGINKSPKLYGAFPTDAYSHTPSDAGAQQPGMTGQVKEDVINRWAELGVQVSKGRIEINPAILDNKELLDHDSAFNFLNVKGQFEEVKVPQGALAFTYCGVLFLYQQSWEIGVEVFENDKLFFESPELKLDEVSSQKIFERSNEISMVRVSFPF